MSNVRSAVRTLKIFEAFAAHGAPMTLSELSSNLQLPPSSCLLLIRTLLDRGYLYATGRRNAYYPTRRVVDVARVIARNDPVIERFQPHLEHLRAATNETVTLAKRQRDKLIYLAVAESPQIVRVSAAAGTLRPLHSTATGKALLGALPESERNQVLADIALERLTGRTIISVDDLELSLCDAERRGYAVNSGEAVADLSAVAIALEIDDEVFAITVMGPSYRVDPMMETYGRALVDYGHVIEKAMSSHTDGVASISGSEW